jgi:hypothetical protein
MTVTVSSVNFDRVANIYNITMSDDSNKTFVTMNQLTHDEAAAYPPAAQFEMTLAPAGPK